MTKVMMTVLLLLAAPGPVLGDLYQYRGSDGQVIITDDASKVPEDQRERAKVKETAPPVPPTARSAAEDPPQRVLKRKTAKPLHREDNRPRVPPTAAGAGMAPERSDAIIDRRSDPRYATPEATWSTFTDALKNCDVEAALDCFLPESATRYRQSFAELGRDKLIAMGTDMRPIRRMAQNDKNGKYFTRKNEFGQEITYYVHFVNLSGKWKIDRF